MEKPTLSPENSISLGRGVALAPASIFGSVLHKGGSRSNMSQHAAKRGHPPGQSPKTSELTGLHALPEHMPDSLSHACRGGLGRQEGADSGARVELLIWHAFACLVSLSGPLRHVQTPIQVHIHLYLVLHSWLPGFAGDELPALIAASDSSS